MVAAAAVAAFLLLVLLMLLLLALALALSSPLWFARRVMPLHRPGIVVPMCFLKWELLALLGSN